MLRLPFLSKRSNPNKFFTIDVSADAVRCLAFYAEKAPEEIKLKIIGSSFQPLEQDIVRAGHIIDKAALIEVVKDSIYEASENAEETINSVIWGITGDLCLGLTTTVRAKKGKPTVITKNTLQELHEKIREATYIQAQNQMMQTVGDADEDLEIITTATIYSAIDGNKVETLGETEGQVIESAVFNALTPTYHLKTLQEISKKTGLKIIALVPELYGLTQTIKDLSKNNTDFIVIDVASDTTNVGVVFGGGIIATKSLNIAKFHFIEGISENMGITLREAQKMLKAYMSGGLSQSENTIVQQGIQNTLDIWLKGLEMLFGEFTGVKTFASQIYITGEGSDIPDLVTAMKDEPWTKGIPFKSPPEFRKISFADLSRISDSTGKIRTAEWMPVASLATIYEELE
jgi:cell division ATPase FtsA